MALKKYRLPVTYKNLVVKEMHGLRLDPQSFDWTEYVGQFGEGEEIVHRPTGFRFRYRLSSVHSTLWSEWDPAVGGGSEREGGAKSDFDLAEQIKSWLQIVKREYEAPDLWAAVRGESELITGGIVEGDEYFSKDEQRRLGERIDQLETQVNALAPQATQEQRLHVQITLRHAKDASKRVSRIDWKSIFVGKLFDIIIALGLDPQKAQQLLHFATLYIGPFVSRVKGLLP